MLRLKFVISLIALLGGGAASAQSLSPMRAERVSFTDRGAIAISIRNPYPTAQHFSLRITDLEGHPIDQSWLPTTQVYLGPAMTRQIYVVVGFEGMPQRSFRVCVTSAVFYTSSGNLRGEVCGKYHFYAVS